jgi:hypothetical protein
MFVAEQFLSYLVQEYGKHPVSTDGGTSKTHYQLAQSVY